MMALTEALFTGMFGRRTQCKSRKEKTFGTAFARTFTSAFKKFVKGFYKYRNTPRTLPSIFTSFTIMGLMVEFSGWSRM